MTVCLSSIAVGKFALKKRKLANYKKLCVEIDSLLAGRKNMHRN